MAAAVAYRDHGKEFLAQITGSFAIAMCDSTRDITILAIDRAGIETLCYSRRQSELSFASNVEALGRSFSPRREIDPQAVFNYLFFHMVPAPGTIYEDVTKLLPGQRIVIEGGKLRSEFYWQLEYHDRAPASEAAMAQRFRGLLRESVQRLATPDTATFLSGGTDSSTVAGMLSELRGGSVDAYSIGFDAQGFDETEYARIAARRFGARHREYYVTPDDVVRAIPRLAAVFDEPFGNASAVPAYYCAKRAHDDGFGVMLAGDGGDEIFGGNARYAKQKIFEAYALLPRVFRRSLVEPLILGFPHVERIPLARKAASYIRQANVPLPDRLESYNFLHRSSLEEIFVGAFLTSIDRDCPAILLRDPYFRARSKHPVDRMMHLDLKLTLADNDLRKVVHACQAAGIEARFPLLEDELINFSGELPPDWKVRGMKLRHFFKVALGDFLPPQIIAKSKHGFGLPFGLWLQSHRPLRELAGDSLMAFQSRGIMRPQYVNELLKRHEDEHASYYGVMIWVIMMFEQWAAAHIDVAH